MASRQRHQNRVELLAGTLDMLIRQTVRWAPRLRPALSLFALLIALAGSLPIDSAAQSALPQPSLPAELKMLVRIREKMRKNLEELPNYTCLQRIERTRLSAKARQRLEERIQQQKTEGRVAATSPLDSTDTVQVEVAFVDGKELYSWPGADRFEERGLQEIVGFGTLSTGDFAVNARNLFVNSVARLDFAGEEDIAGRRVVRYDYAVSLFMSRYSVFDGRHDARVPYVGSIWADAATADLVRVEMRAEEVPPPLSIASVLTQVDYASVPLGETNLLLPSSARMVMRFRTGAENANQVEFLNCREFGAESLLSFGEETRPPTSIELSLTLGEFQLPAGISLPLRLDTEINSERAAVGDRIEATLESAIEKGGELLAPKGSRVLGRIRRLERFADPEDYFIVALELQELRTPNSRALLQAELVHVNHFPGLIDRFDGASVVRTEQSVGLQGARVEHTTVKSYSNTPLPGTGELYIQSKRFRIPAGLRMVCRTTGR